MAASKLPVLKYNNKVYIKMKKVWMSILTEIIIPALADATKAAAKKWYEAKQESAETEPATTAKKQSEEVNCASV